MKARHTVFNRNGSGDRFVLSRPDVIARFWDTVDKSAGPDGCWIWAGTVDSTGYGKFSVDGWSLRANRLALEISLGRTLGEGLFAIHSCDNPPCCNPQHLREGTPAENTGDSVSRGRWPRGESSRRSKLTEADVVAIRAAAKPYRRGVYRRLAKQYGITPRAASFVALGRTWKHVEGPVSP